MFIYFLLIRIAALFGHRKARMLVKGQAETLKSGLMNGEANKSLNDAIWIHAASVGEFEQARPLIEKLRMKGERQKIVVTFFSPSGYEARKNYELVDGVFYLPFATRRKARRFLDALKPKMAIFVKYEFWPAYLHELKKRNIPTYSISAIFRPGQLFFLPWGKQHLKLLKCFTHIYVQDESSRALLERHGVTSVSVSGDTRFDRVREVMNEGVNGERMNGEGANERLQVIERFTEGSERVIVAGSTWPKDEELLAKYVNNGETKLILVPHEINEEHLHFIFNLFQGRMVRLSTLTMEHRLPATDFIAHQAQVLVIDSIGLLSHIYRYGQVAYIGGGFGVGIHNTIEAAVYGMPVIFGPNYHHFREAQGLIDTGAARSISNYSELEKAMDTAMEQHELIGSKAAEYVNTELGATEKIYKELFEI